MLTKILSDPRNRHSRNSFGAFDSLLDYVIVFTHIGKGNAESLLTATPILLILQIILLPGFLVLFLGSGGMVFFQLGPFLKSFFYLLCIPFLGAIITQQLAGSKKKFGKCLMHVSKWLPVPLMAFTFLLISIFQFPIVLAYKHILLAILPIYIAFSCIAPIIGKYVSKAFDLQVHVQLAFQ